MAGTAKSPLGCNALRDDLVEAMQARRTADSEAARAEVDAAARAARSNGCDISDLVADTVGTTTSRP